jgi:hypothetical protein
MHNCTHTPTHTHSFFVKYKLLAFLFHLFVGLDMAPPLSVLGTQAPTYINWLNQTLFTLILDMEAEHSGVHLQHYTVLHTYQRTIMTRLTAMKNVYN